MTTSTPEQTALPTQWFQTDQVAVVSEIVASDLVDDTRSLPEDVFSECTNNGRKRGRKRKVATDRPSRGAGTQDDSMARLAATMEIRTETMAKLAATQEILNKLLAVKEVEDRITKLRETRRAIIKEIGGKVALKELREDSESQESRCCEIDELEQRIETAKRVFVALERTLAEACEELGGTTILPSA